MKIKTYAQVCKDTLVWFYIFLIQLLEFWRWATWLYYCDWGVQGDMDMDTELCRQILGIVVTNRPYSKTAISSGWQVESQSWKIMELVFVCE